MLNITVRNINDAVLNLKDVLKYEGKQNKDLIELQDPIAIEVWYPNEKCLFWRAKKWNPFLAFNVAMELISGRKDLGYGEYYNDNNFDTLLDGYRMRNHDMLGFDVNNYKGGSQGDQIKQAINLLKSENNIEQAVLQIWDYRFDGPFKNNANKTNNLFVIFSLKNMFLKMTVVIKSNNLLSDFCNIDYVKFSILHEYVASNVGAYLSSCTYIINNLFIFSSDPENQLLEEFLVNNKYEKNLVLRRLIHKRIQWESDLVNYINRKIDYEYQEPWFKHVMLPLHNTWEAHRLKQYDKALEFCDKIDYEDIKISAINWIQKSQKSWEDTQK